MAPVEIGIHILAKAPLPGWCNTRLAEGIGPDRAAALQEALILDGLDRARSHPVPVYFWVGLPERPKEYRAWPAERTTYLIGMDLGPVLRSAARKGWQDGWASALVLGTDAPAALHRHLAPAIEATRGHDVVLGPTRDGGIYLIGLSRNAEGVFNDVAWGTGKVFEQLRTAAASAGLKTSVLPLEEDVDTPAELTRLAAELRNDPAISPRTADLVSSWNDL